MREVPWRIHLIVAASIIQCNYRAPQSNSHWSSKAVAPAMLSTLGFILATAPVWSRSFGRQPGSSWRRERQEGLKEQEFGQ